MPLPRTALRLTPLAFTLLCMAAQAQSAREAPAKPNTTAAKTTAAPCPDPRREDSRRDDCPSADEPERPVRNNDAAAPQVVADAPLPAAGGGGGPPQSRFERGPLKVRNFGLSLAIDHALSPQWSVGGLVNVSKGRIQRTQTEYDSRNNIPPDVIRSDTTVDTRSTSLAGSLSYFTRDAIAFDGAVSFMRTQLETTRATSGTNGSDTFAGENVSSAFGLFLSASRIWRFGPRAVVPQLGLEFTDTRTGPLVANSAGGGGSFTVGEQKQRLLASVLSVQLQQPFSMNFGTLTPYARVAWRQRLWKDADPVSSSNSNNLPRTLDPDSAESRSSFALAGGVIAQFTRGISTFLDVSYRQGSNQLRETRLGLGVKFEI